jgi:hypothetical protein
MGLTEVVRAALRLLRARGARVPARAASPARSPCSAVGGLDAHARGAPATVGLADVSRAVRAAVALDLRGGALRRHRARGPGVPRAGCVARARTRAAAAAALRVDEPRRALGLARACAPRGPLAVGAARARVGSLPAVPTARRLRLPGRAGAWASRRAPRTAGRGTCRAGLRRGPRGVPGVGRQHDPARRTRRAACGLDPAGRAGGGVRLAPTRGALGGLDSIGSRVLLGPARPVDDDPLAFGIERAPMPCGNRTKVRRSKGAGRDTAQSEVHGSVKIPHLGVTSIGGVRAVDRGLRPLVSRVFACASVECEAARGARTAARFGRGGTR